MIDQVGDLIWVPDRRGENLAVIIVTEVSERQTYTLVLADRLVGTGLITEPEDLLITSAEEWTE